MISGSAQVHPQAVVEDGAELGDGVVVGPFCHVGAAVRIADDTRLISNVVVMNATSIGRNCTIFPQAVLGGNPQSARHKGGVTALTIGDNCTIRELVTISAGTDYGGGITKVGNNAFILAAAHIGHDCIVGNNVTLTNAVLLAGHCEVGDGVGIGGLAAIHQFARIGHNAFIAGGSMVLGDVIPFGMASGDRAKLRGLNIVGLKRAGMTRQQLLELRRAYLMIFDRTTPMAENLERARTEFSGQTQAMQIIDFMSARGKRPFVVPPVKGPALDDDEADA